MDSNTRATNPVFQVDGSRDCIGPRHYTLVVDASGQSVYKWEAGKAHPRAKQLDRLSAVMAMGKRQFMAGQTTSQM